MLVAVGCVWILGGGLDKIYGVFKRSTSNFEGGLRYNSGSPSGRSAARQRACFGSKKSRVRIPAPRHVFTAETRRAQRSLILSVLRVFIIPTGDCGLPNSDCATRHRILGKYYVEILNYNK